MSYLNYTDFKGVVGELIPETLFNQYNSLIEQEIDYYTFNRIKEQKHFELAKKCCITLITNLHNNFKNVNVVVEENGKIKTSESIGEQKESYYVPTFEDIAKLTNLKSEYIYSTIKEYFGLTGLMYRGF
jgi:hypothetical protein